MELFKNIWQAFSKQLTLFSTITMFIQRSNFLKLVDFTNYLKGNEPSEGELGFDAEWIRIRSPSDDKNNLALIQFAVGDQDFTYLNCPVLAHSTLVPFGDLCHIGLWH